MKTISATVATLLVASTLFAADDALVSSIEKQGGQVVRDPKGNIVEVSLARTWATDADVEKLAPLKTLKKLDLSLTYVSDVGAESIAAMAVGAPWPMEADLADAIDPARLVLREARPA